jgi:signal transduction histidine kinase
MKARRFLAKLLGIVDGPLHDLASEASVWSADVSVESGALEIAFSFDTIDPSRNPPQIMARTQQALREWQRRAASALDVSWSEPERWEQTRKITFRVALNSPRFWPRGFAPFGKFAAYLTDESRRILSSQGTDSGFFQKADEVFPPVHAAAFDAPVSAWVLFLRCILDQQFALTVDWLMTSARHPRAVIHDLKREVQMLVAGKEVGRAISNQEFASFQGKALNAVAQMDQLLKSEIFGGSFPAIDVGAAVERFIAPVRERFAAIDWRQDLAPEVYVEIHPRLLESVVLNLVHNAIAAASSSGVAPRVSIVIVRLDTEQRQPQMLLKIANPYDPASAGTSGGTGIGLVAAHHIAEINGGSVFEIPDEGAQIYEVGVLLPLAGGY